MNTEENQIYDHNEQLQSPTLKPSSQSLTQSPSMIPNQTSCLINHRPIHNEKSQKQNDSIDTINTLTHESQDHDVLQQDVEFYQIPKTQTPRNKYGNMIVFCQFNYFLLTLGPNYIFFFLAYLCFTLATIFLVGLANTNLENQHFKIFNFAFCWLQNISYLLVALSNPGVVLPKLAITLDANQLKNKRFCTKCSAIQQRKTYHCRQCDVCIEDYDHHCPWTSKCIGGGNLKRFYLFVIMTPFYIFYYMIVFMICMANNVIEHDKHMGLRKDTFKF